MSIHPTAVVDPQAEIGQDVTIGPMACVEGQTRIGDGCRIGPHATVLRYTTLGAGCHVHAGAVLGDLPQDVSFKESETHFRVGAHCQIREFVTLHRGTKEGSATEIGDHCYLMAFAHCAHNVKLGNGVIIANGALLGGYVEVGERAFISGHALIHQFVRIGRLAMLSGGSGVSKDVPPFCTVRGISTNTVVGLNVVGLRRAGFSPEERRAIKQAFALLYRSELNVSQGTAKIRETFASGPALEICAFVEQSRRGICRFEAEAEGEREED